MSFALSCLLLATLQGQQQQPPPDVFEELNNPVQFSDGETTTMDVRYPVSALTGQSIAAPMLLLFHSTGGSRASVDNLAQFYSERGYFTVTYDARGHGTASAGHRLRDERERIDIAEILHAAMTYGDPITSKIGTAGAALRSGRRTSSRSTRSGLTRSTYSSSSPTTAGP